MTLNLRSRRFLGQFGLSLLFLLLLAAMSDRSTTCSSWPSSMPRCMT